MFLLFFPFLLTKQKFRFILSVGDGMSKEIHLNERLQPQDYIRGGSLSVTDRQFRYDTISHWHNYFEIEIIIDGKGKHIIDGKEYELKPNTLILITPINFHSIFMDNKYECKSINASFTSEMLSDKYLIQLASPNVRNFYEFGPEEFERIKSAFELLMHEQRIDSEYRFRLLEYCLELILRKDRSNTLSSADEEQLSGVKRAILYLELHFREKITLPQLASQAGFNPTYFSGIFHKITGETYIEKLNTLRIRHAKTMLADGYSVSEACFASGFGSLSNFLSIFKAKCGVTPNEYRKRYIKNNNSF